MKAFMQSLFTGWHFARWVQLGLGLFIAIQSIRTHDTFSGIIATILLVQALSNTGCCGRNGCTTTLTKPNQGNDERIEFEEVNKK